MNPLDETTLARHPFRGLLHTICLIAGSLLFVTALWFIWAAIARHRLAAQIDAIRALHQPFELQDFATPPIPDAQNAAVLWKAAFAALPNDPMNPSNSNLEYSNAPPFPAKWFEMEDQSVVVCSAFFAGAEAAAKLDSVDWGPLGTGRAFLLPHLNYARLGANCLADAIIHAHLHHDDALSVERSIDLAQLSRAVAHQPLVVSRSVSTACFDRLVDSLRITAIDLQLRNKPHDPGRAASSARVARLIALLLDDRDDRPFRIAMVDFDRMQYEQEMQTERQSHVFLKPMLDLATARSLKRRVTDRTAAGAPTALETGYAYRGYPTAAEWALFLPENSIFDELGSLRSFLSSEWKSTANRRELAIVLAARLFEADRGRLPASAAELVPKYLPAVPGDVFSPVGTPMKMPALVPTTVNSIDKAADHQPEKTDDHGK